LKGKLIVIEGLDGSGKSTQMELLPAALKEQGIDVRSIAFPDYNDPSSTLVKMYLAGDFGTTAGDVNAYAASIFYAADRYASFKRYWKEYYEDGGIILCGRYVSSNAVHQTAKLPVEQWGEYIDWLYDLEYNRIKIPKPDLVIFLDMPTIVSAKLLLQRYCGDESKKDVHERDTQYLESCRRAAVFAAKHSDWHIISCAENGEPLFIKVILEKIVKEIIGALEA